VSTIISRRSELFFPGTIKVHPWTRKEKPMATEHGDTDRKKAALRKLVEKEKAPETSDATDCSGLRCATLLCGAQAVWGEFMTFDLGKTEKLMNRACQICYDRNHHSYQPTLHGWRKLDSRG
jgi:hypothetical protein